jgi:hypothetical protein
MIKLEDFDANIAALMKERAWPSVTRWQRVEAIPRAHELDRAMRAEVRDPLWMLSRQWQLGEFEGDDAGSPVFAKLHLETTRLTSYHPREAAAQPFDDSGPLEARVERRPVPFVAAGQAIALDIRLLMGRHWSKLLVKKGLPGLVSGFRDAFPVPLPAPGTEAGAPVCAHREAWQHQAAFGLRAMDGHDWYQWAVARPAPRDFSTLPAPLVITGAQAGLVDTLADGFIAWFARLIDQPGSEDSAWDPSRLEYRFGCAAPAATGSTELAAPEYASGNLDWYALDVASPAAAAPPHPEVRDSRTTSFLPVAVEFGGMPNTRWWSFEDRRVNFSGIQPDTTDLAKLLVMEFGLVYANDWCLVPVPLQSGMLAQVRGLAVTNVFGERLWIEAAGSAPEQGWQRWRLFSLSPADPNGAAPPDPGLLMLPTVPKVQAGPALEEVNLVRDEMANMVWGIENTVPLPFGEGRSGDGAAADTAAYFRKLLGPQTAPALLENEARARYQVMTSVPENWIPLIPVHVPGDLRQIQLQRASMPRVRDNDPDRPRKIKPRTSLLREGLDVDHPRSYFLHEEEVPRAGARVSQCYQRTRWTDGRVVLWLGAAKEIGRGEGSSGLDFDVLNEIKK